jgi:hypothetical protein
MIHGYIYEYTKYGNKAIKATTRPDMDKHNCKFKYTLLEKGKYKDRKDMNAKKAKYMDKPKEKKWNTYRADAVTQRKCDDGTIFPD